MYSIDRRLIEELETLRFLHDGRNIVLLGPPGVGKTHLAIGLGMLTAEAGHGAGVGYDRGHARKVDFSPSHSSLVMSM